MRKAAAHYVFRHPPPIPPPPSNNELWKANGINISMNKWGGGFGDVAELGAALPNANAK
jgi:hypothetical protein